ncbi:ferredoxin reductase [Yimella sp. cx-573]|nr:ferredoxin reductase [Yimella sp. cx-573]
MGVRSAMHRVASVLTSPATPEDYLQVINPLASSRQLRGVVTGVRREGARSATIAFRPGRGWNPHLAGQWARIGVEIDGVRQWRSYSLSTAEGDDPEITVTAIGRVSSYLVDHTRVGDLLFLAPPQGEFILPTGPRPLLMITAGSGITPVMSMLRTLVPKRPDADVVLIHSAREPESALFASELTDLAGKYPGLHVITRFTGRQGRIDFSSAAALDELCPDWRSRKAYVCGPTDLLDDTEKVWANAGLPQGLQVERFAPALLAPSDTDGGTITFAKSDKEATADGSTPILQVGEDAGVIMPSGCRMGICRTCLTPLVSGQVRDLRTGEIHSDEGELIQTCITAAMGPVHLEI